MSDSYLLQLLAEHHMACPVCGYDLHRITEPRCPECGKAIALVAAPVLPVRRAWIALLAIWSITAGVGFFLTVISIVVGGIHQFWRSDLPGILVAYAAIGMIPVPAIVLGKRRTFIQSSNAAQWALVTVSAIIAAVVLVTAAFCIR